ncbi:DUF4893 domain-containing protein [Paracoccus sp. p4-l81]|uniref:DUF4893 domain-containing protein n=1 Tax=unclassified Paracoccus (in: a-proteobacteria) TaxID=2688777 RepID=UPI0035BAF527
MTPRTDPRALVALFMASALPVMAGDLAIRPEDQARLDALPASFGAAMIEAYAGGNPDDLAAVARVMAGPARAVGLRDLAGDWTCRVIKIGGITPITVYDSFRCRIGADGSFEKLTGSQRTRGRITQQDDALIYLGTSFVAGEVAPDYASLPPVTDPNALPQHFPDVARVESAGPDRARMLFPAPWLESRFNLLELTR